MAVLKIWNDTILDFATLPHVTFDYRRMLESNHDASNKRSTTQQTTNHQQTALFLIMMVL